MPTLPIPIGPSPSLSYPYRSVSQSDLSLSVRHPDCPIPIGPSPNLSHPYRSVFQSVLSLSVLSTGLLIGFEHGNWQCAPEHNCVRCAERPLSFTSSGSTRLGSGCPVAGRSRLSPWCPERGAPGVARGKVLTSSRVTCAERSALTPGNTGQPRSKALATSARLLHSFE